MYNKLIYKLIELMSQKLGPILDQMQLDMNGFDKKLIKIYTVLKQIETYKF